MLELTAIAGMLGVAAMGVIWSGFVLTILWSWFVVPTFGLQALSLAPAIGLGVVVSYLTHQYAPKTKQEGGKWDETWRSIGHTVFKPAFALMVGWIVKQWM